MREKDASMRGGVVMKRCFAAFMQVVAALVVLAAGKSAFAQGVVTANVEVRRSSVPNSCDFGVFEPEIKITNTGDHAFFLSQAFLLVYFDAGPNEIEAVHPEGTTAAIFAPNGGFKSWDTISIRKFLDFNPTLEPVPGRRANQAWQISFGPINPPGRGPDITMNPGDFATMIVTFRRAGGAFPFDVGCNDFTRVERGASNVFHSDRFYNLFFTSTQQFICEFLNPTTPDPLSGISPITGQSACPQ
jgi:hypothetical protein